MTKTCFSLQSTLYPPLKDREIYEVKTTTPWLEVNICSPRGGVGIFQRSGQIWPVTVFIDNTLWEHSHTYLFAYYLWLFWGHSQYNEYLHQTLSSIQSLKYSLTGPSCKKSADTWFGKSLNCWGHSVRWGTWERFTCPREGCRQTHSWRQAPQLPWPLLKTGSPSPSDCAKLSIQIPSIKQ